MADARPGFPSNRADAGLPPHPDTTRHEMKRLDPSARLLA